jgi:hypothetical protein
MQQIRSAWKDAQKKRARIFQIFICAIMLIASFACMPDGQWNIPVLVAFAAAAVVGCVIASCVLLSSRALERDLEKMLQGSNYAHQFHASIDRELAQALRTRFHNRQYRLHFFLTDSWFVLISANASVIRKREEIRGVSRHLDRRHSQFCLELTFADGSRWLCDCDNVHQELIELIQKEMF